MVDSATILTASGDKNAEEEGHKLIEAWEKESVQLKRIVAVQNLYCGFEAVKPNIIEDKLKDKDIR